SYLNQRTGWKVRNIGPSGATMTADLSREVDDDLVILTVDRPCCANVGDTVSVTVTVGNRGARTQTNVVVNLTAYEGTYDAAAVAFSDSRTLPSLARGDTTPLTFSVPANSAGKYVLEAFVPLALDEIPENNRLFTHFNAASYYFFDDVESGVGAWTRNGTSSDPATWEIVQDGNTSASRSASHAWQFGRRPGLPPLCPPVCPPDFHTLTSGPISATGAEPVYLYFWHRFDLRGRGLDNTTGTVETDVAYVNVSIDTGSGPVWRTLDTLRDVQSEWRAFFRDLTTFVTGPATIVIEFSASAEVLREDGGWWIDDIAIANAPLTRGLVAVAVNPEAPAEPGGLAVFRFQLTNVGDFDDDIGFVLQPPTGWTASIGQNLTRMQPYDAFQARLRPDAEATLFLAFQVAPEAPRGSRWPVPVTATSQVDASVETTFDTVIVINDPLGLAGLERYVFIFLVVFASVVVIAVVIDAVKKQRGVYRRW
ncbi:MAG: hypothetical protein HY557_01920, partial [Euryarchaeota archaeon]|nr:hypothetical protein [Euryarchaeota archaeon]